MFTIGHSNHDIGTFISLLQQHEITALADVRSYPYSRFLPHFNQVELKAALAERGIAYVFLGDALGARPKQRECYVDGKALYEKIAATDEFQAGIQRILNGIQKYQISLMCAEKDPLTCHRAVLVCQHLRSFELQIAHILKDGRLESHQHLEQRMLRKHGFTDFFEEPNKQVQLSFFTPENSDLCSQKECLERAYWLQGDEIAYVEKKANANH
nr:DUF488 domain-containing protein [Oscillatoria sp. FACHB-1406]